MKTNGNDQNEDNNSASIKRQLRAKRTGNINDLKSGDIDQVKARSTTKGQKL